MDDFQNNITAYSSALIGHQLQLAVAEQLPYPIIKVRGFSQSFQIHHMQERTQNFLLGGADPEAIYTRNLCLTLNILL